MDIEQLIHTHGKRLHGFVHRKIANEADVEDILQETYLEAYRCKDKFRGDSKPETWLFGIALNMVFQRYKRAKRCREIPEQDDQPEPVGLMDDPFDIIARQHMLGRMQATLDGISDDQRKPLMLILDGRSYEETANILGIPIGTVRSRVSRVRVQLQACR